MKVFALVFSLVFAFAALAKAESWKELVAQGDAALKEKKYEEGIGFYTAALQIKPNHPATLCQRGVCYLNLERFDDAIRDFDKALERRLIEDGYFDTKEQAYFYFKKAYGYDQAGRHAEAIPIYEKLIVLDKNYPHANNNLAWILATSPEAGLRDPKRAIELAKVEVEFRQWKHAGCLDTLASAYAAAGMFDEAVETQMKALELEVPEEQKKEFQDRLDLFRKKQAFVQDRKK